MSGKKLAVVASLLISSVLLTNDIQAGATLTPDLKKIESLVKRQAELDMFSGT